jgi:hypothetical protein
MDRPPGAPLVAALVFAQLAVLAAQPAPQLLGDLDLLRGIPPPPPMLIRPRAVAAYGALITAATLITLYLYRGRAFIVYWIGSWLFFAGSLALLARGYGDVRLGSVMLGLAQLLGVWSAGLLWLAAAAFPDEPLRWTEPLKIAAATAVWFLATPFVLSLALVLATGPAAAAVLLGWAGGKYFRLGLQTKYIGVIVIAVGMALLCATNALAAAVSLNVLWDAQAFNRLLGVNMIVNMFVALAMHVLVFEDMTDALRRAHGELAHAHQEVKRLVITDPLTGCHNRRFFDEIERREIQRHRRYGAPLSVVFVDRQPLQAAQRRLRPRRRGPGAQGDRDAAAPPGPGVGLRHPLGRQRIPAAPHLRAVRSRAEGGRPRGRVRARAPECWSAGLPEGSA